MKNKLLYEKAKENVESRMRMKKEKEIEDEYKNLLYDSQKRMASKETIKEIKKLYKVANEIKISGLGHSYMIHAVRGSLKEIIKTRIYHPKDITKFKKLLKIKN